MLEIQLTSPADIQNYLDLCAEGGGGGVRLANGTYTLTDNLNIPSGVYLMGDTRSGVILDFDNQPYSLHSIGTVDAHNIDISISNITIQNSTTYGIYLEYVDNSQLDGVDVKNCLYGYYLNNCTATGLIGQGGFFTNNSTGVKMVNSSATSMYYTSVVGNTGDGLVMEGCSALTMLDVGFDENGGNGVTLTDCFGMAFVSTEAIANGAYGIELVSGNYEIQFNSTPSSDNILDGYKLTDTNDRITISNCVMATNGGYGVNVANANCDDNLIATNQFSGNTSGAINDTGTGTLIRSNIGVLDN